MKKIKMIILVLAIILLINVILSNVSFAKIYPNNYEPDELTMRDINSFKQKLGYILGGIRNIGVVVSVITLMIIGIKYIFGSVEEKANYKATLLPYAIGAVLLVAGTTIVSFIYNVFK